MCLQQHAAEYICTFSNLVSGFQSSNNKTFIDLRGGMLCEIYFLRLFMTPKFTPHWGCVSNSYIIQQAHINHFQGNLLCVKWLSEVLISILQLLWTAFASRLRFWGASWEVSWPHASGEVGANREMCSLKAGCVVRVSRARSELAGSNIQPKK